MSVATDDRSEQRAVELARYRRPDGVAWVGESRVIVFDLTRPGARPVALDGTAAWLWHQLERTTSAAALAYRAASAFDADVEDLVGDVCGFLERLSAIGLLRRADQSGADHWPEP
jgi:hypothetical protein